jgi:hypothetical protein
VGNRCSKEAEEKEEKKGEKGWIKVKRGNRQRFFVQARRVSFVVLLAGWIIKGSLVTLLIMSVGGGENVARVGGSSWIEGRRRDAKALEGSEKKLDE